MEEIIREWYLANDTVDQFVAIGHLLWYVWELLSPYAYAFGTATMLLLLKVAKRKPDENGDISPFSTSYLMKDRKTYLIATGGLIIITINIVRVYWPKLNLIALGTFVGVASGQLGVIAEYLGTAVVDRMKKMIDKIKSV